MAAFENPPQTNYFCDEILNRWINFQCTLTVVLCLPHCILEHSVKTSIPAELSGSSDEYDIHQVQLCAECRD